MAKVGFATKFLSNRNYIKEVSVEGKTTNTFNFSIGFYDQYAAQILRSGNCITLLSNKITITKDTFWNPNYLEDLTKYVFFTFNKSFLLILKEALDRINFPILKRCIYLLQENFIPYDPGMEKSTDEELQWCHVKNEHLKKDPKFNQMYSLDQENRTVLLQALTEKITSLEIDDNKNLNKIRNIASSAEGKAPSLLEVLKSINNDPQETLDLIISKLEEAKFEFKLFSKIEKLSNNKNPYGLNGAIAAMVDFFYQHNYFKKEFHLEEIFRAYASFTGNSIAKIKTFLSEFRYDRSYSKHFERLNKLKINKFK